MVLINVSVKQKATQSDGEWWHYFNKRPDLAGFKAIRGVSFIFLPALIEMNVFTRISILLVAVRYCIASAGADLGDFPATNLEDVVLATLGVDAHDSANEATMRSDTAAQTNSSFHKIEVIFDPFAKDGLNEGKKNSFFAFVTRGKIEKIETAAILSQQDDVQRTRKKSPDERTTKTISSAPTKTLNINTPIILPYIPFVTRNQNLHLTAVIKDAYPGNSTLNPTVTKPKRLKNNLSERKKSFPDSFIGLTLFNIILSIFSITLNIILVHYRRKEGSGRSMVNVLYLRNGLADIFVSVGVLLQGPILCFVHWKKGNLPGLTVPAYVSYCITAIAIKMSVFMNCVLGVVRCINIVRPFYHISKHTLNIGCLIYMVFWVATVVLDLWQFTKKTGKNNTIFVVKTLVMKGQPGFGIVLLTTEKGDHGASYFAYHLGNLIQFILPVALPTLICFVLMIVQICHLSKQKLTVSALVHQANTGPNAGKGPKRPSNGNRKASITICLVTIIYVCSSAVAITTWLIVDGRQGYLGSKDNYESLMEERKRGTSWSDLTAIYFSLSTCPLICSTLTPLTLLLRGSGTAFSSVRRLMSRISTASLLLQRPAST